MHNYYFHKLFFYWANIEEATIIPSILNILRKLGKQKIYLKLIENSFLDFFLFNRARSGLCFFMYFRAKMSKLSFILY
jgi:hypothetical protein